MQEIVLLFSGKSAKIWNISLGQYFTVLGWYTWLEWLQNTY